MNNTQLVVMGALETRLTCCKNVIFSEYINARDDEGKIDPQVGFTIVKLATANILDALTPVIRAD